MGVSLTGEGGREGGAVREASSGRALSDRRKTACDRQRRPTFKKPAAPSLLLPSFVKHPGTHGRQRDEPLPGVLPAAVRYRGGARGVSRLLSRGSEAASPGGTHVSL